MICCPLYNAGGQGSGAAGWLDVPLRVRSCDCAISARALCIFSSSKSPLYTTSSSRAAASWFSSSSCLRLAAWRKDEGRRNTHALSKQTNEQFVFLLFFLLKSNYLQAPLHKLFIRLLTRSTFFPLKEMNREEAPISFMQVKRSVISHVTLYLDTESEMTLIIPVEQQWILRWAESQSRHRHL